MGSLVLGRGLSYKKTSQLFWDKCCEAWLVRFLDLIVRFLLFGLQVIASTWSVLFHGIAAHCVNPGYIALVDCPSRLILYLYFMTNIKVRKNTARKSASGASGWRHQSVSFCGKTSNLSATTVPGLKNPSLITAPRNLCSLIASLSLCISFQTWFVKYLQSY